MIEYSPLNDYSDRDADLNANPVKFHFLYGLDLDQDVIRRISLHLSGTYEGSNTILMTPLCKERSPESILSAWDDIFNANKHKLNDTLLGLEDLNRSKFGPRSVAVPWKERIPTLNKYFTKDECSVPPGYLYPNKTDSKSRLRPLSVENAITYLKNDTNSGLPYYTRKGKVKSRLPGKFKELLNRKDPCILFTRTQEGGKTRNVWGYPIADTLLEMMYYRPLLNYQRELSWRSALRGPLEVDRCITNIIDKAIVNKYKIISIDFSGYDATLKSKVQKACFNYIRSLFQVDSHDDLNNIEERFNTISILTPSGIIKGSHGVPSGSTFTNEVDSIGQYLISSSTGLVSDENIQIQGDDGVYCIRSEEVKDFLNCFRLCGLDVNEDKSYVSNDFAIYLQNLYHPDYRDKNGLIGGIYPTYRALNRLLFQERWSGFEDYDLQGKDYYSLRAISILENVKHHPLFEEFVHFIKSIDKYSLKVSRKSVDKYVNYISDTSGSEGFLVNQYGDDLKGIKSFKVWKLINK